jgi:hypothetical protein
LLDVGHQLARQGVSQPPVEDLLTCTGFAPTVSIARRRRAGHAGAVKSLPEQRRTYLYELLERRAMVKK